MRTSIAIRLSCILAALSVLVCCARLAPAGFWSTYHADLIVRKHSDQGPWGGSRWMHWEAPAPGTFTTADAVRFASSHGWVCQSPVLYSAGRMSAWRLSGNPVFPIHSGPADHSPERLAEGFPRHIEGDSFVVPCDSDWIRVEPGSGVSTAAPGFIQVDRSGARMAVYHLWGEV